MMRPRRQYGLQLGLELLLRALADVLAPNGRLSGKTWRWFAEFRARVLVLVATRSTYGFFQRYDVTLALFAPLVGCGGRRAGDAGVLLGGAALRVEGEGRGRADGLRGAGYVDARAPLAGQFPTDCRRQLAVG